MNKKHEKRRRQARFLASFAAGLDHTVGSSTKDVLVDFTWLCTRVNQCVFESRGAGQSPRSALRRFLHSMLRVVKDKTTES
jgi:hypothetical protein